MIRPNRGETPRQFYYRARDYYLGLKARPPDYYGPGIQRDYHLLRMWFDEDNIAAEMFARRQKDLSPEENVRLQRDIDERIAGFIPLKDELEVVDLDA